MNEVRVPVDLLLDPTLTASAKVVWMALRLYPELTGRATITTRRAMNMLAMHDWLERTRKNHLCAFTFAVRNPVYKECLPVRDLHNSRPIVRYLERIRSGYRLAARRGQALAAREAPAACS